MRQNQAYDIADMMTEFFLDRELEQQRKKVENLRRKKAQKQKRKKVIMASLLCAVFLLGGLMMIQLQMQVRSCCDKIDAAEQELASAENENKESLKRAANDLNTMEVLQEAKANGMNYATQDDIIYYTVTESSYMLQSREIPKD